MQFFFLTKNASGGCSRFDSDPDPQAIHSVMNRNKVRTFTLGFRSPDSPAIEGLSIFFKNHLKTAAGAFIDIRQETSLLRPRSPWNVFFRKCINDKAGSASDMHADHQIIAGFPAARLEHLNRKPGFLRQVAGRLPEIHGRGLNRLLR